MYQGYGAPGMYLSACTASTLYTKHSLQVNNCGVCPLKVATMLVLLAGKASQSQRDGLKAVVSDAVLPLIPAVLEEEDPMPLYALKLLVVLLDTHPTWALQLQRYLVYCNAARCCCQKTFILTAQQQNGCKRLVAFSACFLILELWS